MPISSIASCQTEVTHAVVRSNFLYKYTSVQTVLSQSEAIFCRTDATCTVLKSDWQNEGN